ncbi:MAG: hypothetical protein PQJ50_13005 [Spirochaetales bacterium]|nr:hypothetical protein [Spirochaetales bacterium]
MARAKKTDKYVDIYSGMSLDEMRFLRTELDYAIKAEEREAVKKAKEEGARKMRDRLKIHDKIKFNARKGEVKSGEIITISIDKVQVLLDSGEKRTVPYQKIVK